MDTRVALEAVEKKSPRLLCIQKLIPTELSGSPHCLVINPADRCKNKVSSKFADRKYLRIFKYDKYPGDIQPLSTCFEA
jgi:hypothetical protein